MTTTLVTMEFDRASYSKDELCLAAEAFSEVANFQIEDAGAKLRCILCSEGDLDEVARLFKQTVDKVVRTRTPFGSVFDSECFRPSWIGIL